MCWGKLPYSTTILSTIFSAMLPTVPFQPACAKPTAAVTGSQNKAARSPRRRTSIKRREHRLQVHPYFEKPRLGPNSLCPCPYHEPRQSEHHGPVHRKSSLPEKTQRRSGSFPVLYNVARLVSDMKGQIQTIIGARLTPPCRPVKPAVSAALPDPPLHFRAQTDSVSADLV